MELNYPEDDGVTLRSRLNQVWKQTGIKPPELEVDSIPFQYTYLVEIFWDIWNSDGWKWSEIYHYQQVMEIELDSAELFYLRKAFGVCSQWLHKKMKPKKQNKKPSTKGK
jgi:hypothetical protein